MNWHICACNNLGELYCFFVLHPELLYGQLDAIENSPFFVSVSWVKQLCWPQNPHGFSSTDPMQHTFGSSVLWRAWIIWHPTWFLILLSVISASQSKQEILSLLASFFWGIRHSGRFSTNHALLLLLSQYGNESGLLIMGRSSTFSIIFSVSGSIL